MYTLTVLGKKTYISGFAFAMIATIMLVVFVLSVIGLYQISGWLLLALVPLTCSVTINHTRHALLPEKVQTVIGGISLIAGFVYFWVNL